MHVKRRDILKLALAGGFASIIGLLGNFLPTSGLRSARYRIANRMIKRSLGRTGLEVSVIGLGGGAIWSFKQVDVVLEALRMGVNFIDTACIYSDDKSEKLIGTALRDFEGEVCIGTKTLIRSRRGAEAEIRESIARLGVGKVDIVYLHGVGTMKDLEKGIDESHGALAAIRKLQREGLVGYVGISGAHSPLFEQISGREIDVDRELKVMDATVESGVFDVIQVSYHIEFPEVEEIIDKAYEQDVGVVCKNRLEQAYS
ncbi:MAG TPA: hypothetical protein ENF42_00555 [Candidatus Bathyarchaeota archaeon]|nr:hypothetical protein [Candidatus Bathyarchaeota archaeon]